MAKLKLNCRRKETNLKLQTISNRLVCIIENVTTSNDNKYFLQIFPTELLQHDAQDETEKRPNRRHSTSYASRQ